MKRLRSPVYLSLVAGLGLILVLPSLLAGPGKYTYVQATFRDASLDKMQSDGFGPYANAPQITAVITESGEFILHIDADSGRRSIFIYDSPVLPPATCREIPPDTLVAEPVTYAFYRSNNGSGYLGPQVNLLAMNPGSTAQVRVWIGFETALRTGCFYSRYNREFGGDNRTGVINVSAACTDGDGVTERWILSPVDTGAKANLVRAWQSKGKWLFCDMGCFSMPFELVLDRL